MNTVQSNQSYSPSIWEDAYAAPRELVQEHPVSSTMLAFGVGIGVGLLVGHALSESLMENSTPQCSKAEKFGRQMFDALRGALPEGVARHLPM